MGRGVVFISYAAADRWVARQLRDGLARGGGCGTWFDSYDVAGRRIPDAIRDGLASADEVVVLMTPAALASEWVGHELGGADALGLPVTLLLYGVKPSKLPGPWGHYARFDISEADVYIEEARRRWGGGG